MMVQCMVVNVGKIDGSYKSNLRMGKKTQDIMGSVYREFSRQKYNKYKHQFPQLRESEIVNKIIKEWDVLGDVAKDNLKKIYNKKNSLTYEDISSSEALQRATSLQKDRTTTPKKSGTLTQSKTAKRRKSESQEGRKSSRKDDSRPIDSESPFGQAKTPKSKKIVRATRIDYVAFYKDMSAQLQREHPRWTMNQVSSLVRLEWKKRKLQIQRSQRSKVGLRRSQRKLSGYLFFRRERRFDFFEAKQKWNRFPLETKNQWENAATSTQHEPLNNRRTKVTYACDESDSPTFNYLRRTM